MIPPRYKYLVIFLCLSVLSFNTAAQEDSLSFEGYLKPYTEMMDSLMLNLDKSRVPHSILYDRVFPFAMIKDTLTTGDTLNAEFFIQAFSELQRADYTFTPDEDSFDHRHTNDFFYSENNQNATCTGAHAYAKFGCAEFPEAIWR